MALYQYCIGGHVQPNTQNWHFHHVRPLFLFGRRRIKYALDYQQWKKLYCSLLPKAMKNLKYKVIFISNPNPKNPDLQLELLTPEFYLTRLKNFSDFIHTIQCQRETLVTGQRKAELEIEDIEHAAEFYNLDASHGYQLYKLLHDARVRRRKCKNAIAWIDFILEQRPERFVENDPSARIVGTRSRDYAPRALPELFEWENEGQTNISVS